MSQYSIFAKLGLDMKDFDAGVASFQKQMKAMSREIAQVSRDWGGLDRVGQQLSGIGESISKHVTLPLLAIGAGASKAAIDFESAFAGVRKTVDASEADLGRLSAGIRQMALEIPASAEEIAAVAEAAGQLGIKTENILGFTRTMIDLGEATNLTADQAATLLARFANVTGLPQEEFDRLGSTIVSLGNNFATTEAEIVEMGQRLAAAGSIAGLSAPEIMGFAAALTSVGVNAEAGGTAFSKLFAQINSSVMMGGSQLEKFAEVAGMSAQQFATAYRDDAAGAITTFIEGLKGIMDSGGNVYATLSDLEVQEIRMLNAMLSAAGAGDLLSGAIDNANRSFEENTALTREAEQRYATTASQLKMLWNSVKELGYQFGELMLPALRSVVDSLKDAVKWFSDLDDTTKKTLLVIGGIAAAFGPAILAIGKVITTVASVITTFGSLKVAVGALSVLFTPVTAAVAAFAGAAVVVYRNWDEISQWFSNTFPRSTQAFSAAVKAVREAVEQLWGKIRDAFDYFARSYQDNVAKVEQVKGKIEEALGFRFDIEKAMQASADVVDNFLASVVDGIGNIFSVIGDLAKFFWSGYTNDWRGGWEAVQSIASTIWESVVTGFARFSDSVLAIADGLFGWVDGWGDKIKDLRSMFQGMIPVEEVTRDMGELEAANLSLIGTLKDQGVAWEDSGTEAEKAAKKAAEQQENVRREAERTDKAIQDLADSYTKSMAQFDREVQIGVRIADTADVRMRHEIEALTKSLESAAKDVTIDLDSAPVVALRQRLGEAKAELIGLAQQSAPAEVAVRDLGWEISEAATSLGKLSANTGNAISKKVFEDAAEGAKDVKVEIEGATDATEDLGAMIMDGAVRALEVLGQKGVSAGQKINDMVEIGLSMIPGIGTVLAGALSALDNLGLGLDDIGKKIYNLFTPSRAGDNAAEWFREVERRIRNETARGIDAGTILADLKIDFPDVSEATLKALVDGTFEAFAEYNKWLGTPGNGLWKGANIMSDMLIDALESGLSGSGAIESVIGKLFAMSSSEIAKIFNLPKDYQKKLGYDGLTEIYTGQLQILLDKMKDLGVEFGKSWEDIVDPAEQAAIELEAALMKIKQSLEKNLSNIDTKVDLGMMTDTDAAVAKLREYEQAINRMIEANISKDDPRFVAIYEAWKALGGGVKEAADTTATEAEKMEARITEVTGRLAKVLADNAEKVKAGTMSEADATKAAIAAYARAINDLIEDAGLSADSPQVQAMVEAWKALGGGAEDATGKVKEAVDAHEKALQKLQTAYDDMSAGVAASQEAIRKAWESGDTDALSAMQQEAILLRDAIEEMLAKGMNGDDPRIAAWQERLAQINMNLRELGQSTYEVIEPTDKVGQAWRAAGEKLAETLDYIAKRETAGLFAKETDSLREQANAYKRAVEDFLKTGDPDDPRIQGWLEALRQINERLTATGESAVEVKDKFTLAAEAIKAKLDEKLGNLDFDMRFNFEGAEDDLDVQIEKIKLQMKAVNDAITKAGEEGLDKQGEFVQSLIEKYNELFEQLGEAEWQKSQDAVNNLFDTTEKKLADLEAKYKLFGDTQEYLADKMKLLKESMNALLAEGVDADDDKMLELSAQYKAAAEAAKAYADSQKQIEEAIKGAIAAGGDEAATNSALIKLGEAAIELWTVVNEHVQKTAAEAVTWMGGWSQQVMKVFADALTDSKTLREGIIADQEEAFGVFVKLLQVTWGQTWSQYKTLMDTIREFAETTDYADPALRTINAISGSFAFMLDQFTAQFRTAYAAVEEFSKLAKEEFDHTLGYAKELSSAMVDAFKSAAEQIKGAIGDLGTVTVSFTGGPSGEGGIPGMATGGIVPAGFPNDTYPALLTSGEMVIPKPHPLPNMAAAGGSVVNHITVVLDGERIQEFTTRGVVDTLRRAGIA